MIFQRLNRIFHGIIILLPLHLFWFRSWKEFDGKKRLEFFNGIFIQRCCQTLRSSVQAGDCSSLSPFVRCIKRVQKATLTLRLRSFAKSPLTLLWSDRTPALQKLERRKILPTQFCSGDQTNAAMSVQTMTQYINAVQFKVKRFVKWNKINAFCAFFIQYFTKIKEKTGFQKNFFSKNDLCN